MNLRAGLEAIIWLSAKSRRFHNGISGDVGSPDFWDLNSALDWVLNAYGEPDIRSLDIKQKEQKCLEFLEILPALVVLDDVDSLEGRGIEAMSFFLYRTYQTGSKFLLTSRRVPYGMEPNTTIVQGFSAGDDGIEFVKSRLTMFNLDSTQFNARIMNRLIQICDGSPLFIQDLLRLCVVGEPVQDAIDIWKNRGGENARKYALGREFEMLSNEAKSVLLAASLYGGSFSLSEIQVVVELTRDDCHRAIGELQSLFLLPRVPLAGDEPRFTLNVNTRRLVLDVEGNTDLAARLTRIIRASTGQVRMSPTGKRRYSEYSRQAISQAKLGDFLSAEETMLSAINQYPEIAELHGILGWIYKSWHRYTDARERFSRAADLKTAREDTYWHWSRMEQHHSEWTSAALAAECGIAYVSRPERLYYMAGFSRSRLAQDLYRQAQYGRSKQEASSAETHLKLALLDLEKLEGGQYEQHSRVYRAMTINYEYLVLISQAQQDNESERRFKRLLASTMDVWCREHPQDLYAISERQRITHRLGDLENVMVSS